MGNFIEIDNNYQILEVYAPPRPCSSIKYRIRVAAEPSTSTLTWNQTMQQRISPATLYGLPLVTKSTIQLKYPKQCVIFVHKTNPSEGVFIGGAGLLISAEQDKEKRKEITDVGITNNACRTKVVQEIIERIIDPVVNGVPSSLQFKGMMLLGPPGVGKSYSLRVVKQVCADRCQVGSNKVPLLIIFAHFLSLCFEFLLYFRLKLFRSAFRNYLRKTTHCKGWRNI
jgi:hypothetical protein